MQQTLIVACGALAREIVALKRANGWYQMTVQCLPAELHNHPDKIPGAVKARLDAAKGKFAHVFVAYGDCGTGGLLDKVLKEAGVERLPGAHCYQFFAGLHAFDELSDAEPGTFYLTDFLARHFQRIVISGLGMDRHPELRELYFGNYRKLVYLAQTDDEQLRERARAAARQLNLTFEYHSTGYGELEPSLQALASVDVASPVPFC